MTYLENVYNHTSYTAYYVGNFEVKHDSEPVSSKTTRKHLRNSGKSYTSTTGKIISERKVRDLPICKNKCKEKVSREQQQMIFDYYWKLGYYQLRQIFVANLIDIQGIQSQRRIRSPTAPSRRKYTFKYYLEIYGERISVCQKCFRYTLCETEQFVRTTVKKKMEGTVMDGDSRGGHRRKLDKTLKNHL